MSEPPNGDDLARSVARRAARRAYWQAHGERSLARNLAMIGALGWLVVTPTVGGLFLGRWLDRRFDAGIFWTGALIVAGLTLGCVLAWRRIEEIQREDRS
ncbi:MAG: ATPase F0F1 [Phenylobacterium sp.]|uniref:AtpZ/AtpI family protein n=1 Tax=Phenylobacterium sp. TaxID=1871053 RepID=UPI0025DBC722|nr:AtpZ/AtpI family protein [Phenylobacterium sp.]MBI1197007.1 ATPase F0F1 [Phenylobacterium sp.]